MLSVLWQLVQAMIHLRSGMQERLSVVALAVQSICAIAAHYFAQETACVVLSAFYTAACPYPDHRRFSV